MKTVFEGEVIISQSDVDELEKARLKLWELAKDYPILRMKLPFGVTDAMWRITYRKYPKAI